MSVVSRSPTLKISVITAVYNNDATLRNAIESIFKQNYKNIELIIIDGGSTDSSVSILNEFSNKINILVSEPDSGIYDALNKGIALATGDLIGFMHSDDLFYDKHVLNKVVNAFNENEIDAVYGDLIYVDKENTDQVIRYWKSGEYHSGKLARGWMPPHPTFYMKRSYYEKLGGFDLKYKIAADYDAMLRYLVQGQVTVHYIPEVLVRMRLGGVSNRSLRNMMLKSLEDYRAIKNNHVGGINTLLMKNLTKIPQFFKKSFV